LIYIKQAKTFERRIAKPFVREHRVMGDIDLQQDVLDELVFEPSIDARNIEVAVASAVVTLTGHVGTYAEKQTAVAATKRVRGVRAIADDIEVRAAFEKTISDSELAKRVVDILDWDIVVSSSSIQAVVRAGWVTLAGIVDWQYQRTAAEDDVRKLSDVRGVINGIALKPCPVHADDVASKIEQALRRRIEMGAKAIRVRVEDGGQVVLEGKVDIWTSGTPSRWQLGRRRAYARSSIV
jgi:osmotically-inducible protein OsmY